MISSGDSCVNTNPVYLAVVSCTLQLSSTVTNTSDDLIIKRKVLLRFTVLEPLVQDLLVGPGLKSNMMVAHIVVPRLQERRKQPLAISFETCVSRRFCDMICLFFSSKFKDDFY